MDADRLKRLIESDPHVDVEKFGNWAKANGLREFDSSQNDFTSKDSEETFDFKDIVGDVNIRGQRSRPGLGSPDLKNEKGVLRNRPNEDDEYEVFRTDALALSTYRKMSLDPEIAFGTFLLKGWIAGLPYSIDCIDPLVKGVVDNAVSKIWKKLVRNMLDAIRNGFSFGEKVWSREETVIPYVNEEGEDDVLYEGKVVNLKKVKFLDPDQNFKFFKGTDDEITRVTQKQRGGNEAEVERSKLVWFILDREYSSVFGKSRYKNIYPEWYYGKLNNQYLLNDLQKRGAPHLEIRYPKGKSKYDGEWVSNSTMAMNLANMLRNQGVAALPSETHDDGSQKWQIKYADTKGNTGENSPFLSLLKYYDKRKLKGLGVPPAVGDSESNFSVTDAQGDMLVIIVEDIVSQIEDAIQDDVIDPLVEYNFGPQYKSLVDIKIDKSALGRRSLAKEILKTMLRTGTSMKGHTLKSWPDPASIIKDLGLTSSTFNETFTQMEGTDRPSGETPVDEAQDDEDSNTDRRRDGPDERDRERDSSKEDATETE